jgi:hypothetical protein
MPEGVGGPESAAESPDVNFDDLLPPETDFDAEPQSPAFSAPEPAPEQQQQQQAPAFPRPPSMSGMSFDAPNGAPYSASDTLPHTASGTASNTASDTVPGTASNPQPAFPTTPVANASGMGISFIGAGAPHGAPSLTPAQVAANSQSLRIRLLRPDGKPFDGPEITTGPKDAEGSGGAARTGFDGGQRGPKKQAPKVVVKTGPLERIGHILAVLAISALGIVPLGYLLLQSVHDREDKLAAKITVPTKMSVLDGTSDAYLGAMAVVLLVVALGYWTRLKRRRAR